MKPWDAVDAVAIEQRDRRVPELRRARDERFRQRRPVEKGERGGGVEFDVNTMSVSQSAASVSRSRELKEPWSRKHRPSEPEPGSLDP